MLESSRKQVRYVTDIYKKDKNVISKRHIYFGNISTPQINLRKIIIT